MRIYQQTNNQYIQLHLTDEEAMKLLENLATTLTRRKQLIEAVPEMADWADWAGNFITDPVPHQSPVTVSFSVCAKVGDAQ